MASRKYPDENRAPNVNLDEYEIPEDVRGLVSKELCEKHCVVPVSRVGTTLIVAMADPRRVDIIDDLMFETGYSIEPTFATKGGIERAIARYWGPSRKLN
jgi:type IV pilus assembly protein PilB